MITSREWREVSEAFDGPLNKRTKYGLCHAAGPDDDDRYYECFEMIVGIGFTESGFIAARGEARPWRATVAALFAAMTPSERRYFRAMGADDET